MTVRDMRPKKPVDKRASKSTSGFEVKVRAVKQTTVNGDYYANTGDRVLIKFDIVDKGIPRSDIDKITLKVPLVRVFKGEIVGEMFLDVSIIRGTFTISGKFTTNGRWVLDFDEVNEALKSINSYWKLSGDKITFLV